jgi:hypothetical protein
MMQLCRHIFSRAAAHQFTLQVVHLAGAKNLIADALSRFQTVTANTVSDYHSHTDHIIVEASNKF